MGILLSCQSISKSYSERPLFSDISLGIEEGQRIGLIGPNGAGKSTLMKILVGDVEPDRGEVIRRRQLRVTYVPQQEQFDDNATIVQLISQAAASMPFEQHEREAAIDSTIKKFGFADKDADVRSLSGGWRKRLALACAFAQKPELLLVDEPTNHLDLQSILWLEETLKSADFAYALVTHDRAFLENIANRIIEINPTYSQGFLSVNGKYSDFLLKREEELTAQQHLQQAIASQVRREVAWLQRGARARQTKSSARIKEAGKLMEDLSEVKQRNALATAQIEVGFDASGRKTKELFVAKEIAKAYGETQLFSKLDVKLTSNFKLGLVGRNGSGKSTLLRIIIGQLQPDAGTIKRADQLKVVWFDQNRAQLDQSLTLAQSLWPVGDMVPYRGRSLHVATWAKKFLFKTDQLHLPISYLSGGEQARILIAQLMTQTADILILDEPTNDLDVPSIELLEESLIDFPGAVVLVTHDRMMLDTVSSQILALDGTGAAAYFSDYEQLESVADQFLADKRESIKGSASKANRDTKKRSGLSTAEKRELAAMPEKIEEMEKQISKLQSEMENPKISSNYAKLQELMKEQQQKREALEALFTRWEELEARSAE
ncbi:MAG TPA: ABC-F family ATP-binding cassette domain-containing protein [Planktothrix sp.]|jgi:ATP-binding cassette subfamily F protein uup